MRLIIYLPWLFVFTAQLSTKRQPFQTGLWFGREHGVEGHGLCLTFGWGRFTDAGKWTYTRWLPVLATKWRNSADCDKGHA